MVESGFIFNQAEYDATLGLPEDMRGALTPQAQMLRYQGLVEQGVPDEVARDQLGLTVEDFQVVEQSEN